MSTHSRGSRVARTLWAGLPLVLLGLLPGLLADEKVSALDVDTGPPGSGGGGTPPPGGGVNFVITARPQTAGAVRITSVPAAIDCLNNDNTRGDRCVEPFAANTDLRLIANPQPGFAFERWQFGPCNNSTSPECRFTVARPDSARAITRAVDATCPIPPVVPLDRTLPASAPRTATYGQNLLANSTFSASVAVGGWPSGFGYWRGDEAARAPSAQQGIVPRTNDGMLHLIASTFIGASAANSAAEQMQLVDVSALRADIDNGLVIADASAWFARVGGCSAIDTRFTLILAAYDGAVTEVPAKASAGTWLRRFDRPVDVDQPGHWTEVTSSMRLPQGTTIVAVWLGALENTVNDGTFPELHGHYADDVSLVVRRDP